MEFMRDVCEVVRAIRSDFEARRADFRYGEREKCLELDMRLILVLQSEERFKAICQYDVFYSQGEDLIDLKKNEFGQFVSAFQDVVGSLARWVFSKETEEKLGCLREKYRGFFIGKDIEYEI